MTTTGRYEPLEELPRPGKGKTVAMANAQGVIRAAIYRRISDDREGEELGIARQLDDMREFCASRGYVIVDDYTDNDVGASTRSRKPRPDYDRLLDDAKRGLVDVIIAYTSNRLTRRPRELEGQIELAERYGTLFEYLRSPSFDLNTAHGRMVARILASTDAAEAEIVGERVARARRQQAEQGRNGGGTRRFGWEPDGVTIRPDEAKVIRELADAVLGGASLHGLARSLNERGVRTVRGERTLDDGTIKPVLWHPDGVSRVIRNSCNAGVKVYKGEPVATAGQWWHWPDSDKIEPILSRETWEACRALLDDPTRKTSPGNKPKWLGSLIYRCGHPRCAGKHTMTVRNRGTADGRSIPTYRCREVGHNSRDAQWLDAYITDVVVTRLAQPDAVELLEVRSTDDAGELARQAATKRERIAEAKELWQDGTFTAAEMKSRVSRLRGELADVEARIAANAGSDPLAGIAGNEDAAEIWAKLDLARRRAIVARLLDVTVLVQPRGRPRKQESGVTGPDRQFVQLAWHEN